MTNIEGCTDFSNRVYTDTELAQQRGMSADQIKVFRNNTNTVTPTADTQMINNPDEIINSKGDTNV